MKTEIIISGFGGQGVLSMGKILAYSGLMEGKEITWMPAYGPEQRGGTANVTVIVSDERISSPILSKYDVAIVLNQPSLDKFMPRVKKGGIWYCQCASKRRYSDLSHRCHGQGSRDEEYQGVQHDSPRRSAQSMPSCQHGWIEKGPVQKPSRAPSQVDSSQHGSRRRGYEDYPENLNPAAQNFRVYNKKVKSYSF